MYCLSAGIVPAGGGAPCLELAIERCEDLWFKTSYSRRVHDSRLEGLKCQPFNSIPMVTSPQLGCMSLAALMKGLPDRLVAPSSAPPCDMAERMNDVFVVGK